jgi:hypothetical protein
MFVASIADPVLTPMTPMSSFVLTAIKKYSLEYEYITKIL